MTRKPSALHALLRESANRLRLNNIEVEQNAAELEALATALSSPNGFIVKVEGGALRYDLCAASMQAAHAAASKHGLEDGNYTVEPFLILHAWENP